MRTVSRGFLQSCKFWVPLFHKLSQCFCHICKAPMIRSEAYIPICCEYLGSLPSLDSFAFISGGGNSLFTDCVISCFYCNNSHFSNFFFRRASLLFFFFLTICKYFFLLPALACARIGRKISRAAVELLLTSP